MRKINPQNTRRYPGRDQGTCWITSRGADQENFLGLVHLACALVLLRAILN